MVAKILLLFYYFFVVRLHHRHRVTPSLFGNDVVSIFTSRSFSSSCTASSSHINGKGERTSGDSNGIATASSSVLPLEVRLHLVGAGSSWLRAFLPSASTPLLHIDSSYGRGVIKTTRKKAIYSPYGLLNREPRRRWKLEMDVGGSLV